MLFVSFNPFSPSFLFFKGLVKAMSESEPLTIAEYQAQLKRATGVNWILGGIAGVLSVAVLIAVVCLVAGGSGTTTAEGPKRAPQQSSGSPEQMVSADANKATKPEAAPEVAKPLEVISGPNGLQAERYEDQVVVKQDSKELWNKKEKVDKVIFTDKYVTLEFPGGNAHVYDPSNGTQLD